MEQIGFHSLFLCWRGIRLGDEPFIAAGAWTIGNIPPTHLAGKTIEERCNWMMYGLRLKFRGPITPQWFCFRNPCCEFRQLRVFSSPYTKTRVSLSLRLGLDQPQVISQSSNHRTYERLKIDRLGGSRRVPSGESCFHGLSHWRSMGICNSTGEEGWGWQWQGWTLLGGSEDEWNEIIPMSIRDIRKAGKDGGMLLIRRSQRILEMAYHRGIEICISAIKQYTLAPSNGCQVKSILKPLWRSTYFVGIYIYMPTAPTHLKRTMTHFIVMPSLSFT